jgi:hypothetical protein
MNPKFRAAGPTREYEVLLEDEVIGRVRYWERRYYLRRVYVSKGWRATLADGTRLYHPDGTTGDTRRSATWALIKAHQERTP